MHGKQHYKAKVPADRCVNTIVILFFYISLCDILWFYRKEPRNLSRVTQLFFAILWFTALPAYVCSDINLLRLDMPQV